MFDAMHNESWQHLQLGEGVLLRNADADALLHADSPADALNALLQDPAHQLGVTLEGCTFRCIPDLMDLTRGQRTAAADEAPVRRWEATLTGTLLEMSPQNVSLLLNLPNAASTLTPAPAATPLANVCWIGLTGGGLAIIELQHPVCTSGLVLRTKQGGLGELPFTLTAHSANPADPAPPCRFLWLREASA